jgi:uncharacterized protein YqcC (DUF446 family)
MRKSVKRSRLGESAAQIEAEMRRLGLWLDHPPSEQEVLSGGAFGLGTVGFDTWLQVIFVTRLRQVAAGEFDIPASSSVAAQAVREWDGDPLDRHRLLELVQQVDALLGRRRS